jgi:GMP synthase-like glutamine amidotransferase
MKVLVIQNCLTEDIGLYENCLQDSGIKYYIYHAYTGEEFPLAECFDALIVGGTPISVYDFQKHDFLRNEMAYLDAIVKTDKPYLGICGGGQLLAKLLGGQVRKNPVPEIGGYEIKLTPLGKKHKFFKGFPDRFPVFQWHRDTFDIPKGGKLLAEGTDCKNQAFSYKKSLALQFHLEADSLNSSKWAEEYKEELKLVNKTKTQIVKECKLAEKQMKELAYLLIRNFFTAAKKSC